jgi:hypothetical protein
MPELVYRGPHDEIDLAGVGLVRRGVPVQVDEALYERLLDQADWRPQGAVARVRPAPEPDAPEEPEPDGVAVIAVEQLSVCVQREDGSLHWYHWAGTDAEAHVAFTDLEEVLAAAPATLRADGTRLKDRTKAELEELLEARGLAVSGTKAELVERLLEPPDPAGFVVEHQDAVEGDSEPVAYPEPEVLEQPDPEADEVEGDDGPETLVDAPADESLAIGDGRDTVADEPVAADDTADDDAVSLGDPAAGEDPA